LASRVGEAVRSPEITVVDAPVDSTPCDVGQKFSDHPTMVNIRGRSAAVSSPEQCSQDPGSAGGLSASKVRQKIMNFRIGSNDPGKSESA